MQREAAFREELLREGIQSLLIGDLETGKAILRDYIKGTLGFRELSLLTHKPTKSLMRMFSPTGNPQARNLFEVISRLQEREGVRAMVQLQPACETSRERGRKWT